jgi:pimeloyl-ACP methyl ester carboxylesterase
MGEGSPSVLLEASGPGNVLQYAQLQRLLAGSHRVCAYDRAGMGWSDDGPLPRDARALAQDLEKVVRLADIGPAIFVASSAGGLTVELYLRDHPDGALGLVGADALWSDGFQTLPELRHLQRSACLARGLAPLGVLRAIDPFGLRRLPGTEGDLPAALTYRTSTWRAVCSMVRSFQSSAETIRNAAPLPAGLKVRLLVHGEPRDVDPTASPAELASLEPRWQEAQRRFAGHFANTQVQIVAGAGHLIATERPDLVAQAVDEITRVEREKSDGVAPE